MKAAIIHYHLRPGGVTRVLQTQVQALRKTGHEVQVIAGTDGLDLGEVVIPGLDYGQKWPLNGWLPSQIEAALRNFDPDMVVIHNAFLGLNNAFPDLVDRLANSPRPVLFQCHDFPEDQRPANFQRLPPDLYPIADHLHYAVINQRDLKHLLAVGFRKSRLHYLPNAVNPPTLAAFPEPHSAKPNYVFYPVRGMRRKNLGEFLFLAKHAPPAWQFIVAMGPEDSSQEKSYLAWQKVTRQLDLSVRFSVVDEEEPFPGAGRDFRSWLTYADHIATTSVAEGFGLTFLEAQVLGVPLFGRDLPAITQDFPMPAAPDRFYSRLPVPAPFLPKSEPESSLRRARRAYGTPTTQADVEAWKKAHLRGDTIDFGRLPVSAQIDVLKIHYDPTLARWLEKILTSPKPAPRNLPNWDLTAYSKALPQLVKKVAQSQPSAPTYRQKTTLLPCFLDPQNHIPLLAAP